MREKLNFIVNSEFDNQSVKDFLKYKGVSLNLLKQVKFTEKGIRLNGERVNTIAIVKENDEIEFDLPPDEIDDIIATNIPVKIVYESDDAIVFEKPANMPVHPSLGHPDDTLANAFKYIMAQRGISPTYRPVYRLDNKTSGLVLCGLNQYATPLLFKSTKKEYTALVEGNIDWSAGSIEMNIAREDDTIIKRCVDKNGVYARTNYKVIKRENNHTLVQCDLVTGRTHQIRVHFSSIGYPLAGDDLYGGSLDIMDRQALHCSKLSFIEPITGEKIVLNSNVPF